MAQRIEIVRGTTNDFDITVVDVDFLPYTLEEGEKIIFGVKQTADSDELLITKTAAPQDGVHVVTLDPEDTSGLECGRYVYDVSLQSGAAFYNIIEPSPLIIQPNVTSRGCAD